MKVNDGQEIIDKLNKAMQSMSREDLEKVVKEAVARAEELEGQNTMFATHIKVLCHKNGGVLTYTKDEFEAAAKDNQTFQMEYGTENGKETCFLKLVSREKSH